MEVNEIIEELKYYNEDLPKEALKEAINHKKEITPKLLEMLEYTKNNLEKIYYEEDNFFGYNYAIYLLAEFREKKAFPYLIDLLHRDENQSDDIVEYILGDDYPGFLPRLLASTYNGDDKALFDIIEDRNINEFIRSSTLATFEILYLNDVKDRNFIVEYFKKLINNFQEESTCLEDEIIDETKNLRLIELDGTIDKLFNFEDSEEEFQELKEVFANKDYKINKNVFPFKGLCEYIYDTIGIMEDWQCFRYREDREFEQSNAYKVCEYLKFKRNENIKKLGSNDLCWCGSGKKFKNCCMKDVESEDFNKFDFIDDCVCKAEWYLERNEIKKACSTFKMCLNYVQDIFKEKNVKSISEYDERFKGFDFLLNWLQKYDEILAMYDEEDKLYDRIKLWDNIEEILDFNDDENLYWKELAVRSKANAEFKLGNEEKATKIIRDYLSENANWIWGYIEMADWYIYKRNKKYYNLEKAKSILTEAEKIDDEEDMIAVYERLINIYDELGNKEKSKEYEKKWDEYVNRK